MHFLRKKLFLTLSLSSLLFIKIIFGEFCFARSSDNSPAITDVIQLLLESNKGKKLVDQAILHWSNSATTMQKQQPESTMQGISQESLVTLNSKIKWGDVSKTDATITRNYDPITGRESRSRDITIYLKGLQSIDLAVIDLAHELTHAISRPGWDPYDADLTVGKYVWHAIEGTGGEVDAVINECVVVYELSKKNKMELSSAARQCDRAIANMNSTSIENYLRKKLAVDFYKVGSYHHSLSEILKNEIQRFPFLSSNEPLLLSSTANAPYPLALAKEYNQLTEIACENSRRRLDKIGFTLGGAATGAKQQIIQFIKKRCNSFDEEFTIMNLEKFFPDS